MKTWPGSCHCGAIGYDYATEVPPPDWSIRACQCAFCRAHDALSTSDPKGEIRFPREATGTSATLPFCTANGRLPAVQELRRLHRCGYRHGKGSLRHHQYSHAVRCAG